MLVCEGECWPSVTDRQTDRQTQTDSWLLKKKKKKVEHFECWFSLFGCCLLYLLLYIDDLVDVSVCAGDESHAPLTSVLRKGDCGGSSVPKEEKTHCAAYEQKPLDLHTFVPLPHPHPSP